MKARVLRPAISLATVGAVIIAALAVYLLMGNATTSHADSTYNPVTGWKLCNGLPANFVDTALQGDPDCADNLATSANANTTNILTIPIGDLNFSNVTTFTPNGFTITDGDDLAESIKIGGLNSKVGLGLLNGACTTPGTQVDFILYNVDLPDNPTDPRSSTNIAYTQADGTDDRFGDWHIGAPAAPLTAVLDTDTDGKADANTGSITNYPSHLLDAFDPDFLPPPGVDGGADPIVPLAVYGGLTNVAGSWIPLYFAQFASSGPNALAGNGMPGAASLFTANMGQPNVSVLNDPTSTATSPSSISDFCSQVEVTTMLLGDPAGAGVRQANPAAAGTYWAIQYNASLRDPDQDGLEGALDGCEKHLNAGDPRVLGSGDNDQDGLLDECDPDDNDTDADQDDDLFENRQDNCPLDANGGLDQKESEVTQSSAVAAADLGPKTDGMGDACDTGAGPAGATQNGQPISLTYSPTVGNGRYHVQANVNAKCIGGTDADLDGHCSTQDSNDTATGSCPHPACTTVRHNAWGATHPGQQMDTDGDKLTDAMETYLGTDATKACAQTAGGSDEGPLDNWPLDIVNDNGLANSLDLTGYSTGLGKYLGEVPAATARLDFNNDGFVSTQDLAGYASALGKGCGSFGTPVVPPVPAWSQQ